MVRNEKKGMTAGEIADKICEIAPEALQETWDNSGFLAGSRKHPVTKVLTCLDLDFSVLKEAERLGCEMIVTHHPLLFSGIKKLTDEDPAGRLIRQLVQHDIAVYSCHTPFDKTKGGNNDVLAGVLKLSNVRNLAGEKVGSPEDMVMRKEEADIGRCGEFRRPISVEGIDTYRDRRSQRSRWIGTAFSQSGIMHRCRGRSSADGAKAWMRCLCDRRCKIS